MKKSLALLFLLLPLFLFSQNNITMSDAILKGRSALAPANLRQLQWIPETPQFTHVVSNKLVRVNAPDLSIDTLDLLPNINEKLTALGMPAISSQVLCARSSNPRFLRS